MNSFFAGAESDVESELVDLGATPLRELRSLEDVAVVRSLRQVVERTAAMRFKRSAENGGGGRID